MKKIIAYFIIVLFVFSCERKFEIFQFDCENCYREKPEYGPIIIYFSIDEENDSIQYTIYKGNFEERNVEYRDTAFYSEVQIDVPVDKYYSIEAVYLNDTDTIYVVDGDKFNVRRETEQCDEKCYYFKDGIYDVRLME